MLQLEYLQHGGGNYCEQNDVTATHVYSGQLQYGITCTLYLSQLFRKGFSISFRLRNDLYRVGWGVKLYSLFSISPAWLCLIHRVF